VNVLSTCSQIEVQKGTSLYLDLVRFSAALVVFLDHASFPYFTGGLFWQLRAKTYGQTSVTVFFVLSGYVIAHVLKTREHSFLEYATSRLGRLYSVVLPALLLTAGRYYLCLLRGSATDRYMWIAGDGGQSPLRYLATMLFVNRIWLWPNFEPSGAEPFWSLSFEAFYYVAIGFVVFAKGQVRWFGLTLLCLLAGPSIVLLMPIWLLGYVSYRFAQKHRVSLFAGVALWLASTIAILYCFSVLIHLFPRDVFFLRTPATTVGAFFGYYAVGICFSVNIIAFNSVADRAELILEPFAPIIRWLGSMTFALYLFHFPLMNTLATYRVGEASSWVQRIWLVGGTFLIAATLGHACEHTKGAYKRWFASMLAGAALAIRRKSVKTQ